MAETNSTTIKGISVDGVAKLIDYTTLANKPDISAETQSAIEALDLDSKYAAKSYETQMETLVGEDEGKSIRTISAEEIAKIVDSADPRYDTLKEIADWIVNDTTGAAKMANDIQALLSISAATRLTALEASAHTHSNKSVIDGISSQNITDWNAKQAALSDNDGGYGQRIKAIEDELAAAIDFDAQTY